MQLSKISTTLLSLVIIRLLKRILKVQLSVILIWQMYRLANPQISWVYQFLDK